VQALVIDDSAFMRKVIVANLKKLGFGQVHQASDGKVALGLLGKVSPEDLIITDLNMPNMNGLDFVAAIRKNAKLAETRIIAISGELTKENIVRFGKLGVRDFVFKPFNMEQFLDVVKPIVAEMNGEVGDEEKKVGLDVEEFKALMGKEGSPELKVDASGVSLVFREATVHFSALALLQSELLLHKKEEEAPEKEKAPKE